YLDWRSSLDREGHRLRGLEKLRHRGGCRTRWCRQNRYAPQKWIVGTVIDSEPSLLQVQPDAARSGRLGLYGYHRHAGMQCEVVRDLLYLLGAGNLQLAPKIVRHSVLIGVALHIGPHAVPEFFLSHIALKHADDGLPLSVGDVVERLFRHIAARHRLHNGMGRAFRILPHCPLPIGLRLKPDHPFGMETVRGFVLHPGGEPHSATNCPTTAW